MATKTSPLMEQFGRIKGQHPDAILFFRVGDFYETFHGDAVEAARLLGITLTSRNKQDKDPIPLAGIPWHQRDVYVARLLRQGRRVAICEQLEDPATAKGLVDRGVTEVLTPGSVVNDAFLVAGESNYLAVVLADGTSAARAGLALVEASTGEFLAGELSIEEASAEIGRYPIAEYVLPAGSGLPPSLEAALFGARAVTRLPVPRFALEGARALLAERFGGSNLDALASSPLALRAAAAALSYLGEVQGSALAQMRKLTPLLAREHLGLDPATRRALELFEPAPGGDLRHTLWAIANHTVTAPGARRLRSWLERPLVDPAAIGQRLDAVETLVRDPALSENLRALLDRTYDLERLVSRVAAQKANARDLLALRTTLELVPAIRASLVPLAVPSFVHLAQALDAHEELVSLLGRALTDEPPVGLKEGGILRPGYDAALDELRELMGSGKRWILEFEAREREATGIGSLKVGYNRVFGYFIEVTRAHASRVPAGYERRQTLANAERYVTGDLKEREAQVLGAEERLRQAEYEGFLVLREKTAAHLATLQDTARALAQLDALCSLATLATTSGYVRPHVHGGARLLVQGARHPVVEGLLPPGRFVPNDVDLDPARHQIVLLTGPNMAGKSTYMRQIALAVVLAQAGSFVPALAAEIGVVDQIFTRVGAADHVAGGQSTFMLEMLETANLLRRATARSLVLLDEVGRGTSTYDGMSLAWAVTEELHRESGPRPRTLFATHYHELTALADHLPRVVNRSVKVEEYGDQVIFLHQVVDGPADRSYGIHVAQLAGMPAHVVARAKDILALLEASRPDPLDPSAVTAARTGGASLAADRKPGAVSEGARPPQLSLFGADPRAGELRALLAELDLETLSPREALALLFEWKERLGIDVAKR